MKHLVSIILFPLALLASEPQPILVTVDENAVHFRVEGKGGMYPKPLPSSVTIPDGATTEWDGETLTLTVIVTTAVEGEEPTFTTTPFVLTEAEIAEAWAYVPPPPELPLRERLLNVAGGFPPEVLAAFPFDRAAYWFDRDRQDVVQALIQGVDVSAQPQAIQDAKAAMLAQFPTTE
ncbi:MAG: hypothetical protein AAGJ81_14795 [Verrucomicrobiota bacterium]